ncbi:MAG: threonylcarbamoyl-AMP synthase [Candidatus Bathyarchaeum sp.]|nr:MAG: threonylcarbamoyl-AMP synthase [Candidatus Bathyarchaeum sp.]
MTLLKATKNNIITAAQIVRNGGLVVYPTETVYGLGCDPLNVEAVKRIIAVKGDRKKPLPVLASNIEYAESAALVSSAGKKLAAKFWPGALTMVFPKKPDFPKIVTFGLDSVGLRIPDNDVALQLIGLSGGLLVGSSANRTGEEPPRSVQEISGELKDMVDVVLDGGSMVQGIPSTVVDLTSDEPRILREGPISLKEILGALAFCDQ